MKKLVFVLAFLFLTGTALAVSTDLKETYSPRETAVVEFFGVLGSMSKNQFSIQKDSHIDTPVEFDVGKIGGKNYIWFISPLNPGNYTLRMNDLVVSVEGVPEVVDYEEDFSVAGNTTAYSVKPGFIVSNKNFQLTATVYSDFNQIVQTNFPEQRELVLVPGVNYVDFKISDIIGTQSTKITLGDYSLPAYITGAEYVCGDGQLNGREVCDGSNLNGQSCSSFSSEFSGGDLKCSATCLSFVTSSCDIKPECGLENTELCTTEAQCSQVGGFWYEDQCNRYEKDAECDSSHLGLCDSSSSCSDSSGFWYEDQCNALPEPVCGDGIVSSEEVCDCVEENCTLGNLNNVSCTALGKNYISGTLLCSSDCLSYNETMCQLESEVLFRFEPSVISSTLLVTEKIPVYRFGITNAGNSTLNNLIFDYDSRKFRISPSENISIESNKTQYFNMTLEGNISRPMKGAIVASTGDKFEYLIFNLNFTENQSSVGTDYSSNSGDGYQCVVLGGEFCESDEQCSSPTVKTLDSAEALCCTGICQLKPGEGGRSWIGYLAAALALIILVFIYLKYRKTKTSTKINPLTQRIAQAERKLP